MWKEIVRREKGEEGEKLIKKQEHPPPVFELIANVATAGLDVITCGLCPAFPGQRCVPPPPRPQSIEQANRIFFIIFFASRVQPITLALILSQLVSLAAPSMR